MIVAIERRVHWGECSPSGAVFYPVYFQWFDAGTWSLFEAIGLPIKDLGERYGVVGLPLSNCGADYLRPVRLSDDVCVESRIGDIDNGRLKLEHRVIKDGIDAVRGWELRFWGLRREDGTGGLRRGAIPDDVLAKLQA